MASAVSGFFCALDVSSVSGRNRRLYPEVPVGTQRPGAASFRELQALIDIIQGVGAQNEMLAEDGYLFLCQPLERE